MAKRSLETLTDVLVLVVSPILVMILVISLAFFLIQCFYDGQFFGRLNFATGLFVMAAVLVARIAIEEGREYASTFALPLGIVTILSILQYTDLGLWFAVPLVLFIWWSTDKLTWDCTVLDEDKDASGEGLLQTIGLEEGGENADQDATTDREQTESKSLWQKWVERRRRHHTPGVWVIYFGLAAIPLFGVGQSVLPKVSQGAGFLLLCTYVATALSLLMITSFLQMRRYLIQRRLPFTEKMAAIWLGTGGTMIIALMVFCLLLPRPNTGYSLVNALSSSLSKVSSRDDRRASEWAQGREGIREDERDGQGESEEEVDSEDSQQGRQSSSQANQGRRPGKQGESGPQQGRGQNQEQQQGRQEQSQQQGDGHQDREPGDTGRREAESREGDREQGPHRGSRRNENDSDQERSDGTRQQESGDADGERSDSDDDRGGNGPRPAWQPPSIPNPLRQFSLPPLPKLIYVLFVIAAVLVLLYFYGWQIYAAIVAFLRDLWSVLFGGGKVPQTEVTEQPAVVDGPPSFRSFRDPFASGMAARLTPQQLVAYTFEALQAWAFEQKVPRQDDQTPLEFAGQISAVNREIGPHAQNLAVLYNQAAYAPTTLGKHAVGHVQALWNALGRYGG